jgi:putative thiamine transport system permease protein
MTARADPSGRWLRLAPAVTVAAFVLPIGAGLVGTLLPAFGYLPSIAGGDTPGLAPWRTLVDAPGFATSVRLTVFTGLVATALSVLIALGACALLHGRPGARRVGTAIAPLLAMPHSALAIGFAFLIAPSGWIVRAISPGLTGWDVPPDVATVGHPLGLALIAALLLKEVPYLMLMTLGALNQVRAHEHVALARTLGYGRVHAWLKVVLPQVYPQLRLPVYAVLAFSLSVVDVSMILGPGNPPTLAVLAVRWFGDPDVTLYFPAAAAATLVFVIVAAAIGACWCVERLAIGAGTNWVEAGRRRSAGATLATVAAGVATVLFVLALAAIVGMALWSFAREWRYPDALPHTWTLATWERQFASLRDPAQTTLAVGGASTVLALLLTVACLENETRAPHLAPGAEARARGRALWVLYVPLLVPQVAFMFGLQVLLVRLRFDATLAAVIWAHLVFVLPYLFLSLAEPWRAYDPRYSRTALSLGASRARTLLAIKLPILAKPVLIACAVAFAVSVGQYLPTLFAGSGRVATLTTEAVTLAGGADRRVIGAWGLMQSVFPLLGYLLAASLPALLFARRRRRAA